MTDQSDDGGTVGTCHCGTVTVTLARRPTEVTDCNCSLCRRYGALWAYYRASEVAVSPDPAATDSYAWNGRHIDFHRCRRCGCVLYWWPRDATLDKRGVNVRLLPPEVLAAAKVRRLDGADTEEYLD